MVIISDFHPAQGSQANLFDSLYCQVVSTDVITKDNILVLINDIVVEFDLVLIAAETWKLSYPKQISPVLWGGQEYTVKIQVDVAGVVTKASCIFSTVSNVVLRNYFSDFRRSMKTQAIANELPDYSAASQNEYSLFQQFANPMALRIEHFMKEVGMHVNSLLIQTADLHALNLMYRYILDEDFHKTHIAVGTTSYIVPTVKGTLGVTSLHVPVARKNSLNSLYYEEIPTRFNATLVQETFNNTLMALTHIDELPVSVFPTITIPGKLFIETQGGTAYYDQIGPITTAFGVMLKGKDTVGNIQQETVQFLRDDIQPTKFEWSELSEVKCIGDFNVGCQVAIYWQRPGQTAIRDPLLPFTEPGKEVTLYWDIETPENSYSYLVEKMLDVKDVRDILRENPEETTKRKYLLADVYGDGVLISDFAIDHNWIYAIDEWYLYIYPKLREWPLATKKLIAPGDVDYTIRAITDYNTSPGIGDTVWIEIEHVRATKVPGQFRIYVEKPDGTTEVLSPWTVNQNPTSYVYKFPELEYTLEAVGSYVFTCEVIYSDRSTEKTQQLIHVEKRSALAQYDLRTFCGIDEKRIFRASDQELYIVSGTSIYRLDMYKDKMLVSYATREIFLTERYDGIEVDLDGQI